MIDSLAYFLCLGVIAAWTFLRPRMRLGSLFALWGIGIVMTRVLPGWTTLPSILGLDPDGPGALEAWFEVWLAAGAVLHIRAMIGLTANGRPSRRRTQIPAVLFALGLVLYGTPIRQAGFLIALPWLWSFRWREALSAGALVLAGVGAMASLVFEFAQLEGFVLREVRFPVLEGLYRFSNTGGIFYSLVAIFATLSRVHLSIRRIRFRLLGSHLLAGLVPFVLAVLFLLLSGALYLSTYRGSIGARSIMRASREAEERLRSAIGTAERDQTEPFGHGVRGVILILREGDSEVLVRGGPLSFAPAPLLESKVTSRSTPLLWDGTSLFLRARVDTLLAGVPVSAEALAPIDSLWMIEVSDLVGTPVRILPTMRVRAERSGILIGPEPEDTLDAEAIGPRREGEGMLPGGATLSLLRQSPEGWTPVAVPITSSAGLAEPLLALFSIARENPIATIVLIVLGLIAFFFLGAIWITTTMVTQMSRSITRVIDRLTRAAQAIGEGAFSHRIEIEGKDELWSVAESFNHMAEGLERVRIAERETQRLEDELRLAREIQKRLLPARPPDCEHLELAGLSIPARQVGGDYFDYFALEGGLVGIAVADVSGKGAPAALLMSSFRASLRTQDLAALGPALVLGHINRFIHESVDPGKFITAFLGLIDPETGELRYANAGHDPPLLVRPDGSLDGLAGGGLILGMLPRIVYEEAHSSLEPGSLVAVYTDGVTEARDPEGNFFGPERLSSALLAVGSQPCALALEGIMEELRSFSGSAPQFDDITMVLARRL